MAPNLGLPLNSPAHPKAARFESGRLAISVIAIVMPTHMRTSTAPWYVSGVLIASRDGSIMMHPRWPMRWSESGGCSLVEEWSYLADRVRSGRCGNLASYELIGFDAPDVDAVADVVAELADQIGSGGLWGTPQHLTYDPLSEQRSSCEPRRKHPHLSVVGA